MNEKITCADCKHFNARNNVCAVLENTVRPGYGCYEGEPRIITNGDKIRAMSDEELAKFIWSTHSCAFCPFGQMCDETGIICPDNYISWLEQEAKDD